MHLLHAVTGRHRLGVRGGGHGDLGPANGALELDLDGLDLARLIVLRCLTEAADDRRREPIQEQRRPQCEGNLDREPEVQG